MKKTPTCSIVVYGCAKNQLDAEEMGARLKAAGFSLTGEPAEADLTIVHTCGFVEDAKRESIEGILEMCRVSSRVLVTGCLSQRYPEDLRREMPEISGIAGTSAPRDIVELARDTLSGQKVSVVGSPGRGEPGGSDLRMPLQGVPWAYLRVAEGCRHRCTYCAIPSFRGPLSSRPMEDILVEATSLVKSGVREINLIAQDLSDYGWDWDHKRHLPELVSRLAQIPDLLWVRLLYLRPDGVRDELASAMDHPKVAPYVDLPIEHGSDRVLKRMGRPGRDAIRRAVESLRKRVPNLHLRTTIIAGFPGETERDIDLTVDFLREIGAHRVGVFPFSQEEGTPACLLPDQLPDEVKRQRAESIRRIGLALSKAHSENMVGSIMPALITGRAIRPGYVQARGPHQAPEVDGRIFVKGDASVGEVVQVRITKGAVLDLFAVPHGPSL